MNHFLRLFCYVGLSFFLIACSDSGPNLSEQVKAQIEDGWTLSNFRVIAKENVGSEVSPIMEFRFSATVSPKEDLYIRVSSLRESIILKKLYDSDEVHNLHGTGKSTLRAENWHTSLSYEESPWGRENAYRRLYAEGVTTRDAFSDNALVIGTDEYAAFRDELLAEIEQSKMRIANFEKETLAIVDVANAKRHKYDALVRDSSAAINQMRKDQSAADNELFRLMNRSRGDERQKAYEDLMALRANNTAVLGKARDEHNNLIAERNQVIERVNKEVLTARNEYNRSRMGLRVVLEMEALLHSFEEL